MTTIFYFSGSGNSMAIARDLAADLPDLDAEVRAMEDTPDGAVLDDAVDAVGFVFPNYDFQAPEFVKTWLSQTKGLDGKYLFALCTYGIAAGRSLVKFDALLRAGGLGLSSGFAVMMPHNGIGSSLQPEQIREQLLDNWNERRRRIVDVVKARESRELETGSAVMGFFRNKSWKMLPGLFRYLGVWIREGEQGLAYNASDACTGCGICARVCPVGNIVMEDSRPVWGDTCTNCFGCIHWCPEEAVRLGSADLHINYAYHHPAITLKDVVN